MTSEQSEIVILRTTIGLLSSMIYSGEQHSNESEKKVREAIQALNNLSNKTEAFNSNFNTNQLNEVIDSAINDFKKRIIEYIELRKLQ